MSARTGQTEHDRRPGDDRDDPEVAPALRRDAWETHQAGDYENALRKFEALLLERRVKLGDEHYWTLSALHQTIYALARLGRYGEALPRCVELASIRERKPGVPATEIADARNWLDHVWTKSGATGLDAAAIESRFGLAAESVAWAAAFLGDND